MNEILLCGSDGIPLIENVVGVVFLFERSQTRIIGSKSRSRPVTTGDIFIAHVSVPPRSFGRDDGKNVLADLADIRSERVIGPIHDQTEVACL